MPRFFRSNLLYARISVILEPINYIKLDKRNRATFKKPDSGVMGVNIEVLFWLFTGFGAPSLHKKWRFLLSIWFSDLVTFTKEILSGKLHFLCSPYCCILLFIPLTLPAPCISKSGIKNKAFIKPFEAPQRSVKIKI